MFDKFRQKGAERFYTTENNKARTETVEQAAAMDDKLISVWTGIPIFASLTTPRIELEERLSQDEYLRLLMNADPEKRPIQKKRYCLVYENQYFEIDLFPFWTDQAIVEIELIREDSPVVFPPELEVIREVTGDPDYTNAALAAIS